MVSGGTAIFESPLLVLLTFLWCLDTGITGM